MVQYWQFCMVQSRSSLNPLKFVAYLKINFLRIVLDLWENHKESIENFYMSLTQFPIINILILI